MSRYAGETLHLNVVDIRKVAVAGYQPADGYRMYKLYEVSTTSGTDRPPVPTGFRWMDRSEVENHRAQMSNELQDCLLPALDEYGIWE